MILARIKINIFCNLAVLAAGAPHIAPFMADECLLSLPEMEGIDYTLKVRIRNAYSPYLRWKELIIP